MKPLTTFFRIFAERTQFATSRGSDLLEFAYIREMARNRGCRRHGRTHQMGASAAPLPSFEIAVGGRGAALARLQPVGIHRQAHRASRFAPFETGGEEDLVQAFGF